LLFYVAVRQGNHLEFEQVKRRTMESTEIMSDILGKNIELLQITPCDKN
jgi:hypothetical protein